MHNRGRQDQERQSRSRQVSRRDRSRGELLGAPRELGLLRPLLQSHRTEQRRWWRNASSKSLRRLRKLFWFGALGCWLRRDRAILLMRLDVMKMNPLQQLGTSTLYTSWTQRATSLLETGSQGSHQLVKGRPREIVVISSRRRIPQMLFSLLAAALLPFLLKVGFQLTSLLTVPIS